MGKWKRIILGEKMPDRDDPKYRDRYEKDVEAGRKFARATRIDRLAGHVQRFAESHREVFLAIVLAVVTGCLAVNIVHFTRAYRAHRDRELQKIHVTGGPDHAVMTIPIQPNDHENEQD